MAHRVSRCKIAGFGIALAFYFSAIIFLSAYSLRDQKNAPKSMSISGNIDIRHVRTGIRHIAPAGGGIIHWCSELHYMKQTNPPRGSVALASFPGSGNTWLRYLLQQATGILTGSVYNDKGLLKNGFPAEYINNGSVLVVKTHEWGPIPRSVFSKVILLVRTPADAIQAEFNRQSGGHVGFASLGRYKRIKGKYWQQFVSDKLRTWESINMDWGKNFAGELHVIFYEKLVNDVEGALRGILNFLKIPINEELLSCTKARKEGIYRRKKRNMTFDPFSKEMKIAIQTRKEIVYESLGWNNSNGEIF